MKYKNVLVLSAISLMALSNAFGSEMDSEINDLQVRIIHVKPTQAKPKAITPKVYTYTARPVVKTAVTKPIRANFYKPTVVSKPILVASTPTQPLPVAPAAAPVRETRHEVDSNGNTNSFQPSEQYQASEDTLPQETVRSSAPSNSPSSGQFVRRIELIPAFTLSSFDGGDSSLLQPSGVQNPYNSAPSISLLTDIDFGNANFFVESGFMLSQMGAGTAETTQNGFSGVSAISEKVALTYVGVPLNLKFRLRDQETSSFFIKAGATPVYMASHAYTGVQGGELRFGAYNTFDLLLGAGVGYDLKVWRDFHAVADISAFQGLFPVLTNFSVFNYGVNLGLGLAYML